MPRLRLVTLPAILLLACLAVLPACKKSKPTGGGDPNPAPNPGPGPVAPPSGVGSEYVMFAHVRVKDVIDGPVFAEVKQAIGKAGLSADWDKFEEDAAKEFGGVKPSEIETITACVSEFPPKGEPKFVAIVTASKAIDKAKISVIEPGAKADSRGFYAARDRMLFHFPDAKTLVILSPDLAQKYLDGYAKNRAGWPNTAELTKAAAGHTLFATIQLGKFPMEMFGGGAQMAGNLLTAKTVTLTADLKGKELSVAARAAFPDAASAEKAKEMVQGFIGLGANFLDNFVTSPEAMEFSAAIPAIKEAQRALKDAKVEVVGTDLTVAGSYRANFDIGAIAVDAVKKVRDAATRMKAQNNLRQIGIALHNYANVNRGSLPVHAVGANGASLKAPNDKPLLSWRVAILPYLEQDTIYNQFKLDEPWDSPNNKKLIDQMPKIYASEVKPGKPGYTHLQMAVGPKAMSPTGMNLTTIRDGTSNTIAVAEAVDPVIWTKPDDVMLPGNELPKDLKKKFGGQFPGGFNVLLWDGSTRFVPDTITEQRLGQALTPNGGEVSDTDLDGRPIPKFPMFTPTPKFPPKK